MKYIKLFENFFSKIDFGNQLWVEVTDWCKWDELVWNEQPEELEQHEITQILDKFKSDKDFRIKEYRVVKRIRRDYFESCLSIDNENNSTVHIYKFRDDMWLIEIEFHQHYKKFACDGTEGLLLWLEEWVKKLR
jgi:hypothetical protein